MASVPTSEEPQSPANAAGPLPYGHPMCFTISVPSDLYETTITFYRKVFGWNILPISAFQPPEIANQPKSEGEAEFGFVFEAQKWGGGFVKAASSKERPIKTKTEEDAGAVVYYHVKDVDETLEEIEKAGGRRVGKKKTTGGVDMALFEDVAGNLQGISGFICPKQDNA